MNKIQDWFFNLLEIYGSKISCWGWNKRWKNRKQGTGYKVP